MHILMFNLLFLLIGFEINVQFDLLMKWKFNEIWLSLSYYEKKTKLWSV